MKSGTFPPGARVRVQKNGVPETYDGTVVEPTERQRSFGRLEGYIWVCRDEDQVVVPWRPGSLTLL